MIETGMDIQVLRLVPAVSNALLEYHISVGCLSDIVMGTPDRKSAFQAYSIV